MSKIVTANLLRSGDVVYFAGLDGWVREIAEAKVALDEEQLSEIESAAQRDFEAQLVVSVYSMDVDLVDDRPEPKSVRERIRALLGPTV